MKIWIFLLKNNLSGPTFLSVNKDLARRVMPWRGKIQEKKKDVPPERTFEDLPPLTKIAT